MAFPTKDWEAALEAGRVAHDAKDALDDVRVLLGRCAPTRSAAR